MDKWAMGSRQTAKAAARMCLTQSRNEEKSLKVMFSEDDIQCVAVDFGGEYITSLMKIIESAIVASKREKVIKE